MTHINTELPISAEERIEKKLSLKARADQKRVQFLRQGIIVGVVAEAIFIIAGGMHSGIILSATLDAVIIVCFVLIYAATFLKRAHTLLFHSVIFVMAITLVASYYGPTPIRTLFLNSIVILVAYMLLSRLGGMMWTAVIILSITIVFTLDKYDIVHSALELEPTLAAIISTLLLSSLFYVYEGINVGNEHLILKRDYELTDLNERLENQLKDDRTIANELAMNLQNTQKNNKLLHDSKIALMNVLEDANNLQNELRSEKESVELKVLERTEQLRLEQARLRASINGISSALLMIFIDDQRAIYNPSLVKLFGFEASDERLKSIRSKKILGIVQSAFGKSFDLEGAIDQVLKTSSSFHNENVEVMQKSISIFGSPILSDDKKNILGCVIVMEDKTEAMLLERSKDEFISIASHELRTPLTAIRGNASMLVTMYGDQLPNGDVKEMVSDIKNASVRLIGIVNQFLSTSRLEQKRTVFNLVQLDMKHALESCSKELRELAHAKNLKINCKLPANLPKVYADEARTSEIIINVVGNAIKYTSKGSITVTARAIDGFVVVDVADTGIGIEEKNKELLFHKFQQTTSDILTRDDSRSTGLGLYITKLLTEQMGGRIYLKSSTIGKGSVFTFSLPIAKTSVYSIRRSNEQ